MAVARMVATDEGVSAGETMHKPVFHQEIQRTVYGHRRGASALFFQTVENVVRAGRMMPFPDDLQDGTAQRREPETAVRAEPFGTAEGLLDAVLVIVGTVRKGTANCVSPQ